MFKVRIERRLIKPLTVAEGIFARSHLGGIFFWEEGGVLRLNRRLAPSSSEGELPLLTFDPDRGQFLFIASGKESPVKPGKLLRALLFFKEGAEIDDSALSPLIKKAAEALRHRAFIAWGRLPKGFSVRVESNLVGWYFHLDDGALNSCMTGEASEFMQDLESQADVSLALLFKGDTVVARALLWHRVEFWRGSDRIGEMPMLDRVYSTSGVHADVLRAWASANGYAVRKGDGWLFEGAVLPDGSRLEVGGDGEAVTFLCRLRGRLSVFPYMDSLDVYLEGETEAFLVSDSPEFHLPFKHILSPGGSLSVMKLRETDGGPSEDLGWLRKCSCGRLFRAYAVKELKCPSCSAPPTGVGFRCSYCGKFVTTAIEIGINDRPRYRFCSPVCVFACLSRLMKEGCDSATLLEFGEPPHPWCWTLDTWLFDAATVDYNIAVAGAIFFIKKNCGYLKREPDGDFLVYESYTESFRRTTFLEKSIIREALLWF